MNARPEWLRLGRHMTSRRTVDLGIRGLEQWVSYIDQMTGYKISTKTVGRIERGEHLPSSETMVALESALGWVPGESDRVVADENHVPRLIEAEAQQAAPVPVGADEDGRYSDSVEYLSSAMRAMWDAGIPHDAVLKIAHRAVMDYVATRKAQSATARSAREDEPRSDAMTRGENVSPNG